MCVACDSNVIGRCRSRTEGLGWARTRRKEQNLNSFLSSRRRFGDSAIFGDRERAGGDRGREGRDGEVALSLSTMDVKRKWEQEQEEYLARVGAVREEGGGG